MSANLKTAAPTGREQIAQGKERSDGALGHESQNASSPEGAKEDGKLPHGWTRLTMKEVGRWVGGGTPSKANPRFWTGGSIPWVSRKDMKTDRITDAQDHITEEAVAQSATNLVEAGSILIVVRSGILQHTLPVAVAQRKVALNQDLKAVKPLEIVRSDYLALALKAFERDILHTCTKTGTTVQSLELPMFLRFEIPVAPLPEQRRIVAEIEKQFTRLEAGVTALRRVQANLKRYRAAVLKTACEGRLVPTEAELARIRVQSGAGVSPLKQGADGSATFESAEALLARILSARRKNWTGRGQYKEPSAPDVAKLPTLPEGWTWLSVETIGFVTKLAGFEYTKYVKYSPEGDLAVIKAENAGRSGFKRTEISRIKSSAVAHLTRSQLKAGDLLMVFVGAGTGNVARVPDDQPYFLGPNIAMIRVEHRAASGPYLELFLRSPVGRALTFGFIKAVAQPSLSMGTIRMIPVAVPPLAEQTRIVAEVDRRLSVVEELEAVVNANLQRAHRLRQSILQRAFSGRLATSEAFG